MSRPRRAFPRRLPVGAELVPGGVHFRVWAPRRRRVEVAIHGAPRPVPLHAEDGEPGMWSGLLPDVAAGARYRFRLDDEPALYPDPASRFQPDGPHGPSQVVDPTAYRWRDAGWSGPELRGQVLYELHVGTFTREGTWDAAARGLDDLVDLGISTVELMPVAEFAGRFGWGYDGVDLFAPTRLYGPPDAFRAFVDRAHALGLAVILDVVYNHLGPDGNYLRAFADGYFTDRYDNEWGDALDFDGPSSGPVRELFLSNAAHWIAEYHLDGLRLDATQSIHDHSGEHILAAIARRAREAAGERRVLLFAETEPQRAELVAPPSAGGFGLDAVWNDDFHHSARVAATGRREAYFTDYQGTPQELVSAAKRGWLYQGQRYSWQRRRRGTPAFGVPPERFVAYLANHDQSANAGFGARLHQMTSPGRLRALTALLLLGPHTPLLFQGQEMASSSPWTYFADHVPELARLVRKGRFAFVAQFPSLATAEAQARLPDPADAEAFARCKLDPDERRAHAGAVALHRDLIALRRRDPAFAAQGRDGLDGAVIAAHAFVLRFFGSPAGGAGDRLLIVNLGPRLEAPALAEPLVAPPSGHVWSLLFSTEHPTYGGLGTPAVEHDAGLTVPAEAAVVLVPEGTEQR